MNRIPTDVISKEEQEKIIEENIDLPQILVNKKLRSYNKTLDQDSLISAGMFGLVRGAKRWDPDKAANARSYLSKWVEAEIIKEIYNSRNVHIPFNRINAVTKAKNSGTETDVCVPRELSIMTDRGTTGDGSYFVATATGVDYQTHKTNASQDISKEDKDSLMQIMNNSSLSSIEHQALIHRFGLCGEFAKTLREIAEMTGYTTMGIQKAEQRAINKMRINKDFIEEFIE